MLQNDLHRGQSKIFETCIIAHTADVSAFGRFHNIPLILLKFFNFHLKIFHKTDV